MTAAQFGHPGADRGSPVDPRGLRRVLVVRADNIGDVVTAGPAVRALRAVAPQAGIDLLASPAGARVAPLLPGLSGVLEASVSWQQLTGGHAEPEAELLERVRRGGYDTMIVLTTPSQSPWPAAHLGLLAGIGTRAVHSREFGGAVATHWVTPPPDDMHQVDRGLHLLAAIGLAPAGPDRRPLLALPASAHAEAGAALAASGLEACPESAASGPAAGGPFVALVPGASAPARRYPPEAFGAAAALVAAAGLPVRVLGAPNERELVAAVVAAAATPAVRAVAPTSVPGFAALLARAAVAVTNNSGGMHLADAVGTPVVVTWAGTDPPAVMRPRSVPVTVLGAPVRCAPCRQLRCPLDHGCLAISPKRVAAAALDHAATLDPPALNPALDRAAAPDNAPDRAAVPADRLEIPC